MVCFQPMRTYGCFTARLLSISCSLLFSSLALLLPSLLEWQPKTLSHNPSRPVCVCLCVYLRRSLKEEADRKACEPCAHTHFVCTHIYTHTYVQYRPHYTDWPQGFVPELFPVWGSRERGSSDDEIWHNDSGGLPVYSSLGVTQSLFSMVINLNMCIAAISQVTTVVIWPVSQK